MGKSLVIVESPAKAKTINKYLGKDYLVKSSVGHIRDLPASGAVTPKSIHDGKKKKDKLDPHHALVNRMGIDPYHGWKARYEILPGKEKVVIELKALAEKANHIYLATDLDREGEAIAWHVREVIGGDYNRFSRVIFNEITLNAITQAFKHPGELNIDRVNAQQARRFMDRVVGYMVSPLLWKKIARGLSAGRVQSVAVRLVVEREREIKSFVPKEYWELHANLQTAQSLTLAMQVTHQQEKIFKPINQRQIQAAVDRLENSVFVVSSREDQLISSKLGAPFITSTLQQAASTRLGYGVKKTMMLAQRLYEAGYITYMRTDSTNLSQDALKMARCYIWVSFGSPYLPKNPNRYESKNNSQEAHEAIRPSDVNVLAEQLKDMEADAQKLYQLIWRQFIACQMTPAQYESTVITVTANEFQLRARCRTLRFDGWTKVMPDWHKLSESQSLTAVEIGETLILSKVLPRQLFTNPPARYSEASLVRELEKRGIGRPSTYVSIISTIQDRGYVHMENRRFYANKMGEIVTDRLEKNFSELMDYNFTAKMEDTLDQVAANQQEWKSVLNVFFDKFSKQLKNAEKDPEDGGMRPNYMVMISIDCPFCGRKMGIRTASTGVFLGCSGYVLPSKERCKHTINLIPETESLNMIEGDYAETNALRARRRCEKCGIAMDSYIIDCQRKLYVCGNNPLCDGYAIAQGEFRIKGYNKPVIECEKCRAEMHLKLGRFGKYMACVNEDCKNTRKILSNGNVAPPKSDPVPLPELLCEKSDAYFVLREGAAGVFLAANTFPKSRETRAPLVAELVRFRDCLPEKLRYLADAPIEDDEGNSTLVRFSRTTKQQYICSKKACKATGWTAFYVDGEWQVFKKSCDNYS
ncbi:type I DNA topoisomerase [Sodalis endosymbiont of Henestaris halophilus]|uniref:type I DNA topoisomerase n=1 Tax=Sodalis endosymbiont of Henestaris halophilus TaxID=1929246 RepID=UPI000BBF4573|nr:type I DNA topoisomerase [Sodalis endosymbiont of Henestaris halophilus]SNC58754.1 DNA topoisomerase 1 [Sodalis endosymbiont of Henestaris halophilus]